LGSDAIVFYLLGALAVVASLLVIAQRNPIYSVMLLIASFGALSGLYVLLEAPFVAVIQIIVYAGAIMVLFLFVVMLLNAPHEETEYDERVHPLLRPWPDALWRGAGRGAGRRAVVGVGPRWRHRRVPERRGDLGCRDRPGAVYRVRVPVRSDFGPDSGRDGRRGRARQARSPGGSPRSGRDLMVTLNHYLILSAILFAIGTAGVFVRRNLITILLSIEIMLNAVNLTFVAFGRALGSADGQIIVFFVMTVAAAEAAVGLAIVISLFRHKESLNPDSFASLKW
jgi:NADH-quinone oxidoreductase subunit K